MNLELKVLCILSCFLLHQVICEEFSQCYDDVNICLWTNGSMLTQHDAKTVCQQRNEYFLPRITNDDVQSKLEEFRFAARNLLGTDGFWIDVKAVSENDIHWIDGSPIAAVYDRSALFAVIAYDTNGRQFVFSTTHDAVSAYICQLQRGGSCAAGELSMKSKCYKKFYSSSPLSWFSASNQCLTRGGSLAVFSDIGRPSDSNQLTNWLNASGPDKSYWIGLVKSWWNTTDKDGHSVDLQYSNWANSHPTFYVDCVTVTQLNFWMSTDCSAQKAFVCQNYTDRTTTATTEATFTNSTAANSSSTSPQSCECACNTYIVIGIAIVFVTLCIFLSVIAISIYYCRNKHRGRRTKTGPEEPAVGVHLMNGHARHSAEPPPLPPLTCRRKISNVTATSDIYCTPTDILDTPAIMSTPIIMFDNDRYSSVSETTDN